MSSVSLIDKLCISDGVFLLFPGHCAFGIDTDMQNDVDNEFLHKCQAVIDANLDKMPLIQLSHLMPWLIPVISSIITSQAMLRQVLHRWIKSVAVFPRFWLQQNVRDVIELRTSRIENGNNARIDLLQLMIDAATSNQVIVSNRCLFQSHS